MATLWRKTMYHLGLAPDEDYDDYDEGYDDAYQGGYDEPASQPPPQPQRRAAPVPRQPQPRSEQSSIGAVRPIRVSESADAQAAPAMMPQRSPVVRPVPVASNAKPHALAPVSFNDAQELADKIKGNQPVIMNLQSADRDLARRLIDFASGLCYGIGGQMEKVANHVYLLTPTNVEVSAEERRRLSEHGYGDR